MSTTDSIPAPRDEATSAADGEALLEVRNLRMHFPIRQGIVWQRQVGSVRAVDGVDFTVKAGE